MFTVTLPAVLIREVNSGREVTPYHDNELIVMAYNNENGYDTNGHWNGKPTNPKQSFVFV